MSTPARGHQALRDCYMPITNIRTIDDDGEFWCVRGEKEDGNSRFVIGRAKDNRVVPIELSPQQIRDGQFKARWDAAIEALNNHG